jgi:hypothetical protein
METDAQKIERLQTALNACYTDVQTAQEIQHSVPMLCRRLVDINSIVCKAMNQ